MRLTERLVGLETEYAFTVLSRQGEPLPRDAVVGRLMEVARSDLPHLPDPDCQGLFLQNGARLYIDAGLHPEFATPECPNPWDVVRYAMAGERILERLVERLAARLPDVRDAMLFRCNVDYGGTHATWGCHESYLHRADPAEMRHQIVPHLVSRVIYTGAGGFDPRSAGVRFGLSPRLLAHVWAEVSDCSTDRRGIYHTKDEPLCSGGYHRLHVLCGESLCSEMAAFLKAAATALIVAMVEGGLRPGAEVQLSNPVEAMHQVAADVTCRAALQLADGRRTTALETQRHYLEHAEANVGKPFMPPWTEHVLPHWRAILDRLENGAPSSVGRALDWAIKRELYDHQLERHGLTWESASHWTEVLAGLCEALRQTPYRNQQVAVEFVLSQDSPIASAVEELTPFLSEHGLSWDGLKPLVDLRRELFEIDTRFGEVGPKGVFRALDAAGVLEHHVAGVDNVEHAMDHPPATGRARLRGDCVKRLSGCGDATRYLCNWALVCDRQKARIVDLSDPWETRDSWQPIPRRLRMIHLGGHVADLLAMCLDQQPAP